MELLFAPMEGITFAGFRKLHHELFGGATEYYTPFIAPDSNGSLRHKYLKELTDDAGVPTVPQLLVNRPEAFNLTAEKLHDLGFAEINLNAGCPSGTVFSKHKGAGMLADLESLNRTLDGIFSHAERLGYRVSIKTRMGVHSTGEFPEILEIYSRYPVAKLIVHARCRDDFYQGEPDAAGFQAALGRCRFPAVYNGNIFSAADLEKLKIRIPELPAVMLGRGAVTNPALCRELQGGEALKAGELADFHDRLVELWLQSGLEPRFTVERMKTLWSYWQALFPDAKKERKALFKARTPDDYRAAAKALLTQYPA